jgi:hypothetical protein
MKTKFVEISPFSEDFVRMQQFASTFDHVIVPQRNAKLFAFERDDKTFGYADIVYLPVAFPAFHPGVVTPRGVVEVVQGFKAHCQFVSAGEGFIGVPLDETRSTFPKSMIEGQGFQKMERELYTTTGE